MNIISNVFLILRWMWSWFLARMGCKFCFSIIMFISFCDMILYSILYDFGHIIYVHVDLMNFHWLVMLPNLMLFSCFYSVMKFLFFKVFVWDGVHPKISGTISFLVQSKKNILGMGPIRDIELICTFRPVSFCLYVGFKTGLIKLR